MIEEVKNALRRVGAAECMLTIFPGDHFGAWVADGKHVGPIPGIAVLDRCACVEQATPAEIFEPVPFPKLFK